MYRVRQEDLPFHGSSHHVVGTDNGGVGRSGNLEALASTHSRDSIPGSGAQGASRPRAGPSPPEHRLK